MKRWIFVLMLISALPALGDWSCERARIAYLLEEIGKVEGTFIRNGAAHEPHEAVRHLEKKLERAVNSWFAPDREDWTAEMFIEKLASHSSLSGKPYRIRFQDGRVVDAGEWLLEKLEKHAPEP